MQTQGEAIIGQSQPEAGTVTSPSHEALNVKRCDYVAESKAGWAVRSHRSGTVKASAAGHMEPISVYPGSGPGLVLSGLAGGNSSPSACLRYEL